MTLGRRSYVYTADVLEGSNVPALMGLLDMSKLDVHYSVRTGSFIIPGPGGVNLQASPGTTEVNMNRDTHWLLGVKSPAPENRPSGIETSEMTKSENRLLNSWQLDH